MKKIIASPHAPKAVGPYSQAVEAGGTLYVSGQLPGYTLGDVAKTTVLLQDIGDFAAMNAVYAGFFTSGMPARVCYQVAALPMGALVEIDAVAAK